MKKFILLVMLCVIASMATAAITDFIATPVVGSTTYSEITGTTLTWSTGDDEVSALLNLGFTFPYGGVNNTQVSVCTNGFVNIGTATNSTFSNALASTTYKPVVAPLWDDLHCGRTIAGGAERNSAISYLSEGTAPNRVFTVQYKNANWYYNAYTSWVDFQVKLYESGKFEFIYGPNSGVTPGTSAGASIGCNMGAGGSGNYYSYNRTANTWSTISETTSNNTHTASGTLITFNPLDVALSYPANAATNVPVNPTLTWSGVTSGIVGYKVYFGTDNPPTNIANALDLGNVTSYTPAPPLATSTLHYWKVIPYTASGDLTNVGQFSFTTQSGTAPNVATIVSPANAGINIYATATLNWAAPAAGSPVTSYKLYFGTDGGGTVSPTDIVNGTNLGSVLTYDPSPDMAYSTTYYWQIVPTNYFGDAAACPIWSFTTSAPPLTGIKTIDPAGSGTDNYTTFTAAITALNATGVGAGGVTFNVAAGAVFNEAAQMPTIIVSGTVTNPIIFQKSGTGANPLVTAPGTTGSSDYIFKVTGGDYFTFNGIDVANATGLTTVEMGYWFLGATGNGCQNNTVQNCVITLNRTNTSTKAIQTTTVATGPNRYNSFLNNTIVNSYYGIYVYGVSTVGSEDMNNTIQGNALSNTAIYNIYIGYQTNCNVNTNTITYPATALTSSLYGIYNYYSPSADIHHNTITGGSTTGSYYNLYMYYCGSANVYNNTISGNTATGTSTYYGYYANTCTGTLNFYNNTISNLSSTSTATIYSVYPYNGTAIHNIYGNDIYNFTTSGTTYGIYGYAGSAATANVYNNKVYNLQYNGTGTYIITGIGIGQGSVNNFYNNMVYDIKAPTGTAAATAPQIRGFGVIGGTTNNIYNNSVYLNATGTAAAFSSASIYYSSGTTNDQKNNIFINASTPGASGRAVAFWKSTTTFTNFAATMNNNIYHAGTPDAAHLVFYNGTNSCQTLDEYKTLNAGKDQNSYYEDSRYISTVSPYNLHIDPVAVTRIEGNALPIATILMDIDGDARNATTPDIGADEGAFTAPSGPPNPVTMLSPANDAVGLNPLTVTLSWTPAADGGSPETYAIAISNSMETLFDDPREVLAPTTSFTPYLASPSIVLDYNTVYYWMIYPGNTGGNPPLEDCQVWSFRTGNQMDASTTHNIGNAWPASPKNGTFPVQNLGLTPLTFTAAGTDFVFGGPFTVDPQSTFNLPYTFNAPVTEGPYTGQFTLTETNPGNSVINVDVTANITTSLIVGTGTTNLNLPVYPYFGYSYSQTIYYPSEISYPAGYRIEKLYYYFNGYETCEVTQDFKIFMGHTTTSTFATTASWIPIASMTQVYNQINTPQLTTGGYWMEFVLDTPFIYNGVDNLVIGVEENLVGFDSSSSYFYSTDTAGVNRSILYYSDSTNPDPAAPPTASSLKAGYPNTKFYVGAIPVNPVFTVTPASKDFGQLYTTATPVTQTFTISNTGAGNLPIEAISIAGDGVFTLVNMPTLPTTVTAAEPVTFGVQFNPAVEGTYTATVSITDGLTRTLHTIAISGSSVDISGGYHMATSFQTTAPTYPTYNWIDISASGTLITGLTDFNYSTAIPLGMTFPFFGNTYTDVYVTSNGYLVFGAGSSQDGNPTVIPSSATPNNFISFFWDDMNCGSSTVTDDWVKYANVDGNFVLTYYKLPEYGGLATGWITGQIILYPSGKIKMQFADKGSTLDMTSYSTGIEGATGLAGLQYHADLVGDSVFGPLGESMALAFGTGDLSDPIMTLDAPINVVITTDGLDIDITWDAVTGANSYNVYRSTDPMAADWGTPVANVGGIVYTEAATGTQYFYKVTASSTAPVILGHPTVITPQFNSSKKVKK